jgi:hypothetical protein
MTLGSHQFSVGKSQTHIAPRWIASASYSLAASLDLGREDAA